MNFRRVEKIDLRSCTVSLWLWKGEKRGRILRPKKQKCGKVIAELLPHRGDVDAEDAVRFAAWLSESIAYPLAVFDPQRLWDKKWGQIVPRPLVTWQQSRGFQPPLL